MTDLPTLKSWRKPSLTKQQASVLRTFRAYVKDYGYAPTLAELCNLTRTKSVGSMHKMLGKLVDKGFLEKRSGEWNSARLKDVCPCCGQQLRSQS